MNTDFEVFFNLPTQLSCIIGPDGTFVKVNIAQKEILGFEPREMIGKPVSQFVLAEDASKTFAAIGKLIGGQDKLIRDFVNRCIHKDGTYRWISWTGTLEEGFIYCVGQDVTDKVRAENELEKSSSKFRIIFDSVADGILVQDRDGKCMYANQAGAQMCGFESPDAFINAPVAEVISKFVLVDEDGRPFPLENLPAKQIFSGLSHSPESVMGTVDSKGNIKWSLVKSRAVLDTEGKPYLAVSIFRDITEQRRNSEELESHIENRTQELSRSRQFLDSVIENIPNMIFVKDAKNLKFVRFNKAGEKLLGFSREDLLGKSDYDFFPPDQAEFFVSKDRDVILSGQLQDIPEETIKTKTGERLLHTKKIPIFNETGAPEYLLGISEDITEIKKSQMHEAALLSEKVARAEAEKAADRLEFLSSASKVLSESLDYKVTMNSIAKLCVSYLADWCAIDVIEPGQSIPTSVAVAHPSAEKIKWAERFKKYPTDWTAKTGAPNVVRTGKAEIYPQISDELLVKSAKDPEHLKIIRELGMKSAMVVPLPLGQKVLGTITFIFAESGREYGDADLKLALELASRAALAIENARLYRLSENEILERERVTNALAESEQQFRTLAESIPQLAWMANADGYIFWYNKQWYEYTGTNFKSMEGWGWQSVHDPNALPKVMADWTASIKTGKPFEMEFPLKSASGKFRWFLTRSTPVFDSSGNVVRWFGSNTDIDDQITTQRKLEKAVRARDEFLSIASHELRTPLTSLYLQLQMLQRSAKKKDKIDTGTLISKLDLTTRQAAQLGELIDGLLDVSRIGSGRISIHRESLNFVDLLKEVITRFQPAAKIAGSEINFKFESDIIQGKWDKLRLTQALTNLLSNALKYGAVNPIDVNLKSASNGLVLSFQDKGIGIATEDHERIFERFERAVSHNNISGMGLGLYITREIIESHGGNIEVQSTPGKGSVFTIHLPLEYNDVHASSAQTNDHVLRET